MKKSSMIYYISALAATLIVCGSCQRMSFPGEVERREEAGREASFLIDASSPFGEGCVKSLLTAPDIETRVSCVTLAAYSDGVLRCCDHFDGPDISGMKLQLFADDVYDVYAFVNMGDMRRAVPTDETLIGTVEYLVPGYVGGGSTFESLGLPMAGSMTLSPGGQPYTIAVKRLVAKVDLSLSCSWDGARIESVKVFNLNGRLRPFGASVAESREDILSVQEYGDGPFASEGTFTLYVPENLQGDADGVVSGSWDKKPDGTNEWISDRSDVLSYMEVTVSGEDSWKGVKTYRSYLGGDAVSNFDMARNRLYRWNVRYGEDGLVVDDWKHEGHMDHVEHVSRYVITPEDFSMIIVGSSRQIGLGYETVEYVNGIETSSVIVPVTETVSFSSDSPAFVDVSSSGLVQGVSAGSSVITASIVREGVAEEVCSREVAAVLWDDDWDDDSDFTL